MGGRAINKLSELTVRSFITKARRAVATKKKISDGGGMFLTPGWTITAGLIFALLQSIEYSLTPARREHEARAARSLYLDVLVKAEQLSDVELLAAFRAAAAEDPIIPADSLKRLAYNDVAEEVGAAPEHYYPRDRYLAFIDWVS